VTVTAVDAIVTDVMFVTELNWLLAFDPLARIPGRTVQFNRDPQQSHNYKYSAINRNLCQRVGAVMEDLWHCRRAKSGASRTGTAGRRTAYKPFALLNVYCKVTGYFIKRIGNFKLDHKKAQKEEKQR
jgi:hypothetical protein